MIKLYYNKIMFSSPWLVILLAPLRQAFIATIIKLTRIVKSHFVKDYTNATVRDSGLRTLLPVVSVWCSEFETYWCIWINTLLNYNCSGENPVICYYRHNTPKQTVISQHTVDNELVFPLFSASERFTCWNL